MKRFTKTLIIGIVVLCILLLLPVYFREDAIKNGRMATGYNKVLLIGIDGMEPRVAEKLMNDGKLPNFRRLGEIGDFTQLAASLPPQSPVVWTTIATGTNPGKHNLFDFIRMDNKRYLPELSLAKSAGGADYESLVRAEPFWRITTQADIPTTVIRWPLTFPPEKIDGNMLSGLGVPDIKGFLGGYTFYTSGEIDRNQEWAERAVKVENRDGVINTRISGPNVRKGNEIMDSKAEMRIDVEDKSAVIHVQSHEYPLQVHGWSDWIRVKFKAGFLRNVYGICRAYLISTEPFQMYLSDVQFDPENPFIDISYPSRYSAELAGEIGLYHTLGMPEDTKALTEGIISDEVFLEQCGQIEAERDRMFWREFQRFKKLDRGVFAFVYDTSDRIQHIFWEEKVLHGNNELTINSAVEDYYVKKDRFLGKLLDELDNRTALIIVSDHGFTSFERNVDINSWLWKNGFMTLNKMPDEKHSGELFGFVDWSRTRAYSAGFNGIYINLKARERNGIVEENEKERVVNEIIDKLKKLTDDKYNQTVIESLYRREEVYHGDYVKNAPDIIIGFRPGYRMSWQTAVGGVSPEILSDNTKKWRGDHLTDPKFVSGVIFTNFQLKRNNPGQTDVAPTLLELLGLEIPDDMDGESLI